MNRISLFISLLISLFILNACIKDEVNINQINFALSPEFGVPIAKASLKAENVIANFDEGGIVQVDNDGALSLIYSDSVSQLSVSKFLVLPDQLFGHEHSLSAIQLVALQNNGSLTITETVNYELDAPQGDRLDSLRFFDGLLHHSIAYDGSIPLSGSIRILSIDNSVFAEINFAEINERGSLEGDKNLANKRLLLQNDNNIANGFRVEYTLTYTDQEGSAPGNVQFDLALRNLEVAAAGGFIARRTIALDPDTIKLDLFSEQYNGSVRFENPKMNFYVRNGFGMEAFLDVQNLYGINRNGTVLHIPGSDITDFPIIQAASVPHTPVNTNVFIDNSSSSPSLTELLAFMPEYLSGDFNVAINPDNKKHVFFVRESGIGFAFDIEIPLYGSIADFYLRDTTDVNFQDLLTSIDDASEIEQLDIRLLVQNGYPFDAGVQIIFADSLLQPIDSLFDEPHYIFTSAPISMSTLPESQDYGKAIGHTETLTEISLSRQRAISLKKATRMIVSVFGNTTGNDQRPIKLFADDTFELNLSAKIKLNLNND